MDLRTGRISNRLIGLGLLLGAIRNITVSGWYGGLWFLLQISVPVLMFYLLFLMHTLGAGDIKLFSVISSCIGLRAFISVMIYSFLAGAAISLVFLLYHKNLFSRLMYFSNYVKTCLYTNSIVSYDSESDGKKNRIHFSAAILIGFCGWLLKNCVSGYYTG